MQKAVNRLRYPVSRRDDQVDELHGRRIADPFRWLEDLDSAETAKWIADQNAVTEEFLAGVEGRAAIRERITALWDFERFGVPMKRGGRYFYFRNSGLENQSVLYTMERLSDPPRLLLDPNSLSENGTAALVVYAPSRDGRLFAYSIAAAGSDWQQIRVRDVATGMDLEDRLDWVKFSAIAWTADGAGFFYSRYDEPEAVQSFAGVNYFQKLYYHRIGAPQQDDVLVFHNPEEKEWGFAGEVTEDGRFLVIHVRQGTLTRSRIYYRALAGRPDAAGPIVRLLDDFDARYDFVGNDGATFWFLTDLDAPRGRLIAIDLDDPARDRWREVIPEAASTLESVALAPDRLIACYLEDAHSRVDVFDRRGVHQRTLDLPGIGSVTGLAALPDDPEVFYAYTSFTTPPTIYRYDVARDAAEVFRRPKIRPLFENLETRQIFYTSPDGVRVPMFLVHRRGLELDGTHPTLLYGYGGFNISLTPAFSVARAAWLELGGVFALANIRGGGEYGERWHQDGIVRRKQKGIDDFIAAAEWLIENRYTSARRLAIHGASNGGMLVGAAMNQRPELFGAAIPSVGVMDLLRFHKFTIGWAWISDYGNPDDPEDFAVLLACSPYHNIEPGVAYPATLVTTGDHDDRVVPSHSFKFAAALQQAQAGARPVLIRIAVSAGHGAGKPTAMQIDEAADMLTFLKATICD